MFAKQTFASSSVFALAFGAGFVGFGASTSFAQTSNQSGPQDRDLVVVTGSFIAGTPEDAALPVDVFTAEDLEAQGSPTVVEFVKTLPAFSGGALGEANRFGAVAAGTATVNLRGLGSARTLVLMNGQRVAGAPARNTGESADINLIPMAAIGRIEVLKDGASATYGSDAIGGVVNFITRAGFDGLEAQGDYSFIDGSDGDRSLSLTFGKAFARGNFLITGAYRARSPLDTKDRDWALRSRPENPLGGWTTAANPGTYTAVASRTDVDNDGGFESFTAPASGAFLDRGCTESAGFVVSATTCAFQFSAFDALVNPEEHYQIFSELNYDLTDRIRFHGEALLAKRDVKEDGSTSLSATQFPAPIEASGASVGGGVGPIPATGRNQQSIFYVPETHPGLRALMTPCPYSATICANALANGVVASQTLWRPIGAAGNPRSGIADGSAKNFAGVESIRISGGLDGELDLLNGVDWKFTTTFMQSVGTSERLDRTVNRLQLGLRGFGSLAGAADQCTAGEMTPANAGNNAVGCYWFNPFTNGVQEFASNRTVNPFFNASAPTNSSELVEWMEAVSGQEFTEELLVSELVFSGRFGLGLSGGDAGYAVGVQSRTLDSIIDPNDTGDVLVTPCVDSVPFGDGAPPCNLAGGPFLFLPPVEVRDLSRTVNSVFAEVLLPLHDTFELTLAARSEDYGGSIGVTTNPKVAFKWDPVNWVAFRGSASSTFRAPITTFTAPGFERNNQQFTNPLGGPLFRTVDTFGNPDLKPETADTYNLGVLFEFDEPPVIGGLFRASFDYFDFVVEDEIAVEAAASVYSTMFPSANAATWRCTDAVLVARFTFAGGVCNPNNFLALRVNRINTAGVDLSGLDFSLSWDQTAMKIFAGADFTAGVDGTYLFEYARAALRTVEGIQIAGPIDRVGKYDLLSQFFSYPQVRGNVYLNWRWGDTNLRWVTNYASSTEATTPGVAFRPEDTIYHNLTVRQDLPSIGMIATVSVKNIFDDDPPFYRSQYNYDYTQGEPLGRVFEIALRKTF